MSLENFRNWFLKEPTSDDEIDGRRDTLDTSSKVTNPYLNARRVWNTEAMAMMSSLRAWQAMAILGLMIALVSVMGALYIGSQSKYIPYVYHTDNLGQVMYAGVLNEAAPADRRIIRSMLSNFITHSRMVTKDERLQSQALQITYSYLLDNFQSTQKMNEYLNATEASSPFVRSKDLTVETEIDTILQRTPETWQVDWVETVRYDSPLQADTSFRMRALITTAFLPPDNKTPEVQVVRNPIGMYVKDFNWAKQQINEKQ